MHINDERVRYYEDNKHNNIKYKTVVSYFYESTDSTLKDKTMRLKTTLKFNSSGRKLMEVNTDDEGRLSDSTIYIYNAEGNWVRKTGYGTVYGPGDLHKELDSIRTYDNKGNIIEDSVWRRENCTLICSSYAWVKYKYDSANNKLWEMSVAYGETTIHFYVFNKGKLTLEKKIDIQNKESKVQRSHNTPGHFYEDSIIVTKDTTEKEYFVYDEAGHTLLDSTVTKTDTFVIKKKFGNNKLLLQEHYQNSVLTNHIENKYNNDSSRIETECIYKWEWNRHRMFADIFGSGQPSTCNNERTSVAVYDKDDNELSRITYSHSGESADTNIVIHKYTFSNGKMVCDSQFTTDKSYLYSSRSIYITITKYSDDGKHIEQEETGGGLYASHSKNVWDYNEKGRLLSSVEYSSCPGNADKILTHTYYPDGVTIKETTESGRDYYDRNFYYYRQDGLLEEEIKISPSGKSSQTIYKYIE